MPVRFSKGAQGSSKVNLIGSTRCSELKRRCSFSGGIAKGVSSNSIGVGVTKDGETIEHGEGIGGVNGGGSFVPNELRFLNLDFNTGGVGALPRQIGNRSV